MLHLFASLQLPSAEDDDPAETGLKVKWCVSCLQSSPNTTIFGRFMPQVLESASIKTSLFALKKNTSTITACREQACRHEASALKRLGNKRP